MKALRVVIAVLMTLLVIASARYFGPNRPYLVEAAGKGIGLSHKAPRGHSGEGPAELDLKVDLNVVATNTATVTKATEKTKCEVCMGTLKPGMKIIKCECEATYHEMCGNREDNCLSCGKSLDV